MEERMMNVIVEIYNHMDDSDKDGFTLEDAARDLNNLNIQFNLLEKVVTDGSAVNGCVINTEPAAGEKVTGTVNVYYALTVTGDEGSDEDGNG